MTTPKPIYTNAPAVASHTAKYDALTIDVPKVLASWRASFLAPEWLDKDGNIKPDDALTPERLAARQQVRNALNNNHTLEKPVLGIGLFDNVEIGSGADVLTTLSLLGINQMPVHVRKTQAADFKDYLV